MISLSADLHNIPGVISVIFFEGIHSASSICLRCDLQSFCVFAYVSGRLPQQLNGTKMEYRFAFEDLLAGLIECNIINRSDRMRYIFELACGAF